MTNFYQLWQDFAINLENIFCLDEKLTEQGLINEPFLYKYIGINGLKGMIENHEIWASNIRFMNDSDEFVHGINNLTKVIFNQLQGRQYTLYPERKNEEVLFLEKFLSLLKTRDNPSYISCFSIEHDQLSQWRAYGDYSVEFDTKKLLDEFCPQQCPIRKVVYTEKQDENYFKEIIEKYLKSKEQLIKDNFIEKLFTDIDTVLIMMKNEKFKEENEVRLIYFDNDEWLQKYNIRKKELNFRQGKNYFVPYIKFYQNNQKNNDLEKRNILPITKIIISPKLKSDFDRVEAGLRMLLDHNGYQHVSIVSSEIPYRV